MSARNAWRRHVKEQLEANDAWENLDVSVQDKPNDHHHRREGKLSQSEIDRMVHEAENYRDDDEDDESKIDLRMIVRLYVLTEQARQRVLTALVNRIPSSSTRVMRHTR